MNAERPIVYVVVSVRGDGGFGAGAYGVEAMSLAPERARELLEKFVAAEARDAHSDLIRAFVTANPLDALSALAFDEDGSGSLAGPWPFRPTQPARGPGSGEPARVPAGSAAPGAAAAGLALEDVPAPIVYAVVSLRAGWAGEDFYTVEVLCMTPREACHALWKFMGADTDRGLRRAFVSANPTGQPSSMIFSEDAPLVTFCPSRPLSVRREPAARPASAAEVESARITAAEIMAAAGLAPEDIAGGECSRANMADATRAMNLSSAAKGPEGERP